MHFLVSRVSIWVAVSGYPSVFFFLKRLTPLLSMYGCTRTITVNTGSLFYCYCYYYIFKLSRCTLLKIFENAHGYPPHKFWFTTPKLLTYAWSFYCRKKTINVFSLTSYLIPHIFISQPQCCWNFSWIELQMLLRCCLIHITIIILRHILYLVFLCLCLGLGPFYCTYVIYFSFSVSSSLSLII